MRFGSLLVEAKLTEVGFQSRASAIVEAYRDFDLVFDRELLPRAEIPTARWMRASEFPENDSQEFESILGDPESISRIDTTFRPSRRSGLRELSTHSQACWPRMRRNCSFCVLHDERRPDLREEWFPVMAAVKSAAMRVRLKVLTWQELAVFLPAPLQRIPRREIWNRPARETPLRRSEEIHGLR